LLTGVTSGNNSRAHLGLLPTSGIATPTAIQRFSWIARIPVIITTMVARMGFMQDVSGTAGGTAGVYFEYDPTVSANWRFITRQASASTVGTVTSAIAVTIDAWYVFEARRRGTGTWEFWVNGVLRATSAATLPTTACNFGAICQTATAAARTLELDFGGYRSLAQRFT
jgi:hypothetical protein